MSFAAHRILREGSSEIEFNKRLNDLRERNPEQARAFEEICQRLEFAELLKYNARFSIPRRTGADLMLQYQIDRISVYLTLTALDQIARVELSGKEMLPFPEWFISRLKSEDSIRGVTRLFKRLLQARVDPWLKEFLCRVFVLAKKPQFKDTVRPGSLPWSDLTTEEKYDLIINYLWYLRNQYTHAPKYLDTQEYGYRVPDAGRESLSLRWSNETDEITDKVEAWIQRQT